MKALQAIDDMYTKISSSCHQHFKSYWYMIEIEHCFEDNSHIIRIIEDEINEES